MEPEIPQWAYLVGAIIGTAFAGFAVRMGWKSGDGKVGSNEKVLTLDAALVDSASVQRLTTAIEAATMEVIADRQEVEKARKLGYSAVESVERLTDELKEIRHEIRTQSDRIASQR